MLSRVKEVAGTPLFPPPIRGQEKRKQDASGFVFLFFLFLRNNLNTRNYFLKNPDTGVLLAKTSK